jgi:hypothetical protein
LVRVPVLKIVGAFEQSVKRYPLIPMGTPDPLHAAEVNVQTDNKQAGMTK